MPCRDVTEVIELTVDAEERLARYALTKRTCGQGVGSQTLLSDRLCGKRIDAILAMDASALFEAHPAPDALSEFLFVKHLCAVQAALEVLTGQRTGGTTGTCRVAYITFADGEITMGAELVVDLLVERIRACGGCRTCGRKADPAARAETAVG